LNAQEKLIYHLNEALREQHGEEYDRMTEEEQAGLLIQVINDHTEQMRREHRLRPRS
jgi:hypothetical protein